VLGTLPDPFAELQPVHLGHRHVRDDDVHRLSQDHRQRVLPVCGGQDGEPRLTQIGLDQRQNELVIVDDEDGLAMECYAETPFVRDDPSAKEYAILG